MAMGRGYASQAWTLSLALLCLCVLHHLHVAESATFMVGGQDGWTFDVEDWAKGKSFKAGDLRVFKYEVGRHNVVKVNKAQYDNCSPDPNAKVWESGNDKITLAKGDSYFLCSIPGHCDAGVKIAVHAA